MGEEGADTKKEQYSVYCRGRPLPFEGSSDNHFHRDPILRTVDDGGAPESKASKASYFTQQDPKVQDEGTDKNEPRSVRSPLHSAAIQDACSTNDGRVKRSRMRPKGVPPPPPPPRRPPPPPPRRNG